MSWLTFFLHSNKCSHQENCLRVGLGNVSSSNDQGQEDRKQNMKSVVPVLRLLECTWQGGGIHPPTRKDPDTIIINIRYSIPEETSQKYYEKLRKSARFPMSNQLLAGCIQPRLAVTTALHKMLISGNCFVTLSSVSPVRPLCATTMCCDTNKMYTSQSSTNPCLRWQNCSFVVFVILCTPYPWCTQPSPSAWSRLDASEGGDREGGGHFQEGIKQKQAD